MSRVHSSGGAAAVVLGLGVVAAVACGNDRTEFESEHGFTTDASTDAPDCRQQCSLDGRSVIEACTGKVIETCAQDLACGGGSCRAPCEAAAADRSSDGCEFYIPRPTIEESLPDSCYAAFVVNKSNRPVNVELEIEGKRLDLSNAMFRTNPGDAKLIQHEGPIPAGESVILFLADRDRSAGPDPLFGYSPCPPGVTPATTQVNLPKSTGVGYAFHLKTDLPIAATSIYPFGGADSYHPTATLHLPVTAWAKENILINGWEKSTFGKPAAQIVASADGTEITILPTADIQNGGGVKGGAARSPATYSLDKGQVLQFVQTEEITGSFVSSTKPITIFGGNSCADIPAGSEACDALSQQLPAYEQWGSEYVGVGYRPRLGNEHEPMPYRIVAAQDGTQLDYDPAIPPGAPTRLNAGEWASFVTGVGDAFVVRTQGIDHPIYVAAFMGGCKGYADYAGSGDPEFVNVIPPAQYMNSYSFYADPTYKESSLVVVRSKTRGEFKDVWLECAGNLTDFHPIGTRGDYEYVRVDLMRNAGPGQAFDAGVCQSGLQRMKSDGAFTATIWGWSLAASYAYPGGMAQRKLVEAPLPLIR